MLNLVLDFEESCVLSYGKGCENEFVIVTAFHVLFIVTIQIYG